MPKHDIKEDDCFIVVDAGGGTVDLISYRIKGLYPSLEVSEAVQGSGCACGGAFLNQRFEKLYTKTLSKEIGYQNEMLQRSLEKWERTVGYSEHISSN
jgi:hypothetical protein